MKFGRYFTEFRAERTYSRLEKSSLDKFFLILNFIRCLVLARYRLVSIFIHSWFLLLYARTDFLHA